MISAQVSIYPLGQGDLAPAIEAAWQAFARHDVRYEAGPMSTLLEGDDDAVFAALRDAFAAAAELGGTVMTVTVSNACPSSRAPGRSLRPFGARDDRMTAEGGDGR